MTPFRFAKRFIKKGTTTHDANVGTLALLPYLSLNRNPIYRYMYSYKK
jgi:hypothetical protein